MEMLDFNAIQQPTWTLKLKDDEQTVVNLSAPSVELYDRLTAMIPELDAVIKKKDGKTILAVFKLVAEIMNFNDDGFTFTEDELRTKYKMSLIDIARFVSGYMDFMNEIQNVKN